MQQQSMATYMNNAAIDIVVSSLPSLHQLFACISLLLSTLSFAFHIFHLVFIADGIAYNVTVLICLSMILIVAVDLCH